MGDLKPIEDVCELHGPLDAELLIELPHGATEQVDYDRVRARIASPLPADLDGFFRVNTDVGSPEVAFAISAALEAAGRSALVVRCRLPRTFVDCNRVHDSRPIAEGGMTPIVPEYVTDADDVAWLTEQWQAYQRVADAAYARVCGRGGRALMLHTYAPRSVGIDRIDDGIVAALREAWSEPERWPDRPDVDLITRDSRGRLWADRRWLAGTRERLTGEGWQVEENATYRAHAATTAFAHGRRYPGQTLCLEIDRALLVEEWLPLQPLSVVADRSARFGRAIADALPRGLEP